MAVEDIILALTALIVTVDLTQFALTIEHRGRIVRIEESINGDSND